MSLISCRLVSPKFLYDSSSASVRRDQVAERRDQHLREAVARTHRQLEVGDRRGQQLVATVLLADVIVVDHHRQRRLGIADESLGARVVGLEAQHVAVALGRLAEVAAVLVEDAEVHEDVDARRPCVARALVQDDGRFVVARQVVLVREAEQRVDVLRILREGVLVATLRGVVVALRLGDGAERVGDRGTVLLAGEVAERGARRFGVAEQRLRRRELQARLLVARLHLDRLGERVDGRRGAVAIKLASAPRGGRRDACRPWRRTRRRGCRRPE